MLTYAELLAQLYASGSSGIVLGLERVAAVLARLDHPERRLGAVAHIAGTNGKGSTAAMVAAVARAAGKRVALYTSPHLTSLRERVAIDGAPIAEDALITAAVAVAAAAGDGLTFFELVTVIALEAIARAAVDITVLEVGLGGRLDATNVVAAPVAAVTGVALDHQELLGHDLRTIAGEKAGIFKPGQRVVIGAAGEPEAVRWLIAAAHAAGAVAVSVIDHDAIAAAPRPALAGNHQRANAACAVAIVDALAAVGAFAAHRPDAAIERAGDPHRAGRAAALERAIQSGLAAVVHPGRLEPVATTPLVILDGAHNPHGARALGRFLAARSERPRIVVLAVSADKDVSGLLAGVAGAADAIICTRYDQPRSMTADALAARAHVHHDVVSVAPDLATAVDHARAAAGPRGLVAVAGSLFAVAEVRPRFVPMTIDPLRVGDPAPRGSTR